MIMHSAAVRPIQVYPTNVSASLNGFVDGVFVTLTAGPRCASVPATSKALLAILHPYIEYSHAMLTVIAARS